MAGVDAVQGNDATRVGEWLAASARPDDTVVVTYSHPNVLEASGLTGPYPYLWSLPIRTLDPHLTRMRRLLSRPDAPTWVVQWADLGAWGQDASGRLAATVSRNYQRFGVVWLRDGARRAAAPAPSGCNPSFGED